ncbi:hypothetical protein KBB17_00375 [Candidatus Saccharibacteria bacterium]|jgi:hypothetical protein|nr:hypothetical protein [Candidatus Saccharibacteria bacterium]MBP9131507.1 hypothetical protein [Candidatus Saccharibacteria bacterium]
MINVNLLPDSKLQKLKSKRSKDAVRAISVILIIASIALPVTLLIFDFVMTQAIKSKQNKIDDLVTKFETQEDVQRILTVQNQLNALPQVEANSFKMSNLLAVIEHATPKNVSLLGVNVLNDNGTFEFQVNADSMQSANEFINTLESIEIISVNESGEGSGPISPFEAPVTTSLAGGASEPISFSVKGKLNSEFGKIERIDKFTLKPFKLELSQSGERTIKMSGDN